MTRNTSGDPRAAIESQRRRIAMIGVPAAVTALIDVCEDKKAPAPARATAGTSLLRAAGMFDRAADANQEREPSEMTPAELSRAIADLQSRTGSEQSEEPEPHGGSGVFD